MCGSPEHQPAQPRQQGRLRTLTAAFAGALWAWLAMALLLAGLAFVIVSAQAARAGEQTGGPQAPDIGQMLTPAEIAALDRDARPDGAGLPAGAGNVAQGEDLYATHCAACHGEFAEGQGRIPALLGGEGSLNGEAPMRTIGSYWPHAPGVFDYIHRAMPEGHAFSLKAEEVYALVAYLLHINGIVEDDFIASARTLPRVMMPNRNGFIRPPHPVAKGRRCMRNCRPAPDISAEAPAQMEGVMIGEEEQTP